MRFAIAFEAHLIKVISQADDDSGFEDRDEERGITRSEKLQGIPSDVILAQRSLLDHHRLLRSNRD